MGLEDEINVAPETGDVGTEEGVPVSDELSADETPEQEEGGAPDEGEKPETQEREPTIKELKKMLEEQNRQIQKANNRTQYLQRRIERSGKLRKAEPAKSKPDSDDFETHSEFVEALTEWKVDQRERSRAEEQQKADLETRQADFYEAIETATEKYPDFNEVARRSPQDGGPTITPAMAEVLMDSDYPVDVAYYLGKNVQESVRISRLSPLGAARELGKIEAKIASGGKGGTPTTPQKTKTKRVTPSSPVSGKSVRGQDFSKMSTEEFIAARNKRDGVA